MISFYIFRTKLIFNNGSRRTKQILVFLPPNDLLFRKQKKRNRKARCLSEAAIGSPLALAELLSHRLTP